MPDFIFHPNVYSTSSHNGLRTLLEDIWIKKLPVGQGTIYIISGFANFNGGARFYKTFLEHTQSGGKIIAIFSGSVHQRLSSKQVVQALLDCGANIYIVNRKRLLHAKCYGIKVDKQQYAINSSGNFTGPGLSQNAEASVYLDNEDLKKSNFLWEELIKKILEQSWQIHKCDNNNLNAPFWDLLYDETPQKIKIDESEEITLVVTLQHADTSRVLANKGQSAGKGSQYFWLSKDCFDFFPALTIRNKRGIKGTLSTLIEMEYVDLKIKEQVRVTYEADNNLDFRLGTGALRYTKIASPDDLACLTRIGESNYQLRIINQQNSKYSILEKYAINYIGNRGKRYGYIDNIQFFKFLK